MVKDAVDKNNYDKIFEKYFWKIFEMSDPNENKPKRERVRVLYFFNFDNYFSKFFHDLIGSSNGVHRR